MGITDHQSLVIILRIIILKEILRFVGDYNKYKFGSMDEKKAIAVLAKDKYIKCNKKNLLKTYKSLVYNMEFSTSSLFFSDF